MQHTGCNLVPAEVVRSLAQIPTQKLEREFFIDNRLVRIHFIIVMIRWTNLAPWEFEFPFPKTMWDGGVGGSSTGGSMAKKAIASVYRGTSLIRNSLFPWDHLRGLGIVLL